MKNIIARTVLAVLVAVGLFAAPATAAPLTITLTPMAVIGAPGSDIEIDVAIENTTGFYVDFLSINSVTPDPGTLGFVDTGWFDAGVLPLAPGGFINSSVHFVFDPAAPLMQWESFELEFVYDLFDDAGDPVDEAVSSFAGFRAQAVPEPSSMTLFGLAMAGAAIARRRRA